MLTAVRGRRELDACNNLPHRRFGRYRVGRHLGCALHLCRPRSDRVALKRRRGAAAQVNRLQSRV
jgi:hypothetical protein